MLRLSEIVSPAFSEAHRALKSGAVNQVILKGGRGSCKSSYASVEGILLIVRNKDIHGVVLRKVANTLRTSVYAQYMWAIGALGLSGKFKCTVSPMEMTYKPTGQKIMFFGADDPGKIKSIKVPFGYIGYLHFEELDQFTGEEEIRNIEQSTLRGGPLAYEIKTFNPPRTRDNWANAYCLEDKPGQLIHHSTYKTTPREWLGDRFLSDAEHLRQVNLRAYEHEYLGEVNGTGGTVFENITERSISDEEIGRFDRLRFGIDFGFAVSPFVFIAVNYDRARQILYIIDEIYEVKISNTQAVEKIKQRYSTPYITCDSAEPKSIAQLRELGLRVSGAKKGADSVHQGIKFLQDLSEIVIDKRRTPNAYREFITYEYERTRQGCYISGYPDKNNDSIDAVRYACESAMLENRVGTSNHRIY